MEDTPINTTQRPTALVTGATSGVGLATAARLAGSGAAVIIHGPNRDATAAAAAVIASMHPDVDLHEATADFSSQAEVRALATEVQDRFGRLDVLVNNAAAVFDRWSVNGEGIELTFAVNHLAPYLLTRLLLPTLERSGGRIVIVSSEAHRKAVWNPERLERATPYERFDAYARSKLANLLFNAELARRLDGRSVTTNAMHPGTVRTHLFRPRNAVERIAMPIINLRGVSPQTASDTVTWLATTPAMLGHNGGYYHKRSLVDVSSAASDEQNAFELWKLSAELTDLGSN
jgi:NAD(P)-dependent dehydrogenase (short-subunit alcohol dehydrogenase family)